MQLDLFAHVSAAYADVPGGTLHNRDLYERLSESAAIAPDFDCKVPIGRSGQLHSPLKRKVRWYQQTLKAMGLLERVSGERGLWRLTEPARDQMHRAAEGVKLVAFSTELGVAIWGRCQEVFAGLNEPVALLVTSPPYPLRKARAYGNPVEGEYIDFICSSIEPVLRNLVPGGSVVLNLSNDIFESKSPARSLYLERLTLALHDRLGLSLMDRIPWVNWSKPPGPTYWACVNRVQLTTAYEPVLWFSNDPARVRSDNRRVLLEHTERQRQLIAAGGEARTMSYGDGAYRLRRGSFGKDSPGRIPRNVFVRGHNCPDTRAYRRAAADLSLPAHGAMFPTALPEFFIRLLTTPGELVVDNFGGTSRTGLAAERLGRRWMVAEWILQYLRGAGTLFQGFAGYRSHI